MGNVAQLDVMKWGPNIFDIRNFHKHNFIADGEDPSKAMGYGSAPITQKVAEARLAATLEALPPGVVFSSNPHYGTYAKWDNLLVKAGFRLCSKLCAINRVYAKTWNWKGRELNSPPSGTKRPVWESSDGFNHWIHAMYLVKEPVPNLTFDFDKFDGANGDTDGHKMWNVGYGTRAIVADGYKNFESAFARLAHNCGCAMGEGFPKAGKLVDEEFYTVAAIPEAKMFPKGYTRFLRAGGLKFGHNLKKLLGDTATECFHKFNVLG